MKIYFASPGSQLHADKLRGQAVLLSYGAALKHGWWDRWIHSYDSILLDSGAFSEHQSGIEVELPAYLDWVAKFPRIDAFAGLDDINGDWRRSLRNYAAGGGFPSYHDTDPEELLDELIPMARERGGWLGIGLKPPRTQREDWLRRTLDRIPEELHVHGWALSAYSYLPGFDSFDTTHWWRDALKLCGLMPWLTHGEALELMVKKLTRAGLMPSNNGDLGL